MPTCKAYFCNPESTALGRARRASAAVLTRAFAAQSIGITCPMRDKSGSSCDSCISSLSSPTPTQQTFIYGINGAFQSRSSQPPPYPSDDNIVSCCPNDSVGRIHVTVMRLLCLPIIVNHDR